MIPVKIKDVSRKGAGLSSFRRFEPGTLLVLELGEDALHPVNILARVVRIAPQSGGEWLAGCAFLSELSEEEFAAFRADRKLAANGSRRGEIRHPVQRPAICRPVGIGTLGAWPAEVCDISAQGIGLLVSAPVDVEVRLKVEMAADDHEEAQTLLVSVVRSECQPDGRWLLGCQLLPSGQTAHARVLSAAAR